MRTSRAALPLVFILLLFAIPAGHLYAGTPPTYYFAAEGDDRNDGRSAERPKQSLQLLSQLLAEGGTAYLRRGDTFRVAGLRWEFSPGPGALVRIAAYGDPALPRPIVSDLATDAKAPMIHARRGKVEIAHLDLRGGPGWRAAQVLPSGANVRFDDVAVTTNRIAPPVAYTSGQTYYFSTSGDDNNDGLSTTYPKKTLTLIPGLVNGGNTALLKRGDVWYEIGALNFDGTKGTSTDPMVVGAYGPDSLARPVVGVSMYRDSTQSWTSEGSNVYSIAQHAQPTNTDLVRRVYLSGTPLPKYANRASLVNDSWCWESGRIYVKSSTFNSHPFVETIQRIDNISFFGQNTFYLTIQDLEIRGGWNGGALTFWGPARFITLKNLDLNRLPMGGIGVQLSSPADSATKCSNYLIEDCTIDRSWTSAMDYEPLGANGGQSLHDGIFFGNAIDSTIVRGCTITNFGHCGINFAYTDASMDCFGFNNILVERNTVTAGNSGYCRAIAITSAGGKGRNVVIRRNYFHDLNVLSQFSGDALYIYSNIFDRTAVSPILANVSCTFGIGTQLGADPQSIFRNSVIANNTFTDADGIFGAAANPNDGVGMHDNHFVNNLLVDWRTFKIATLGDTEKNSAIYFDSTYAAYWKFRNNGFYKTGGDSIVLIVDRWNTEDKYTVTRLNGRDSIASGNQLANPQFAGGSSGDPNKFVLSSSSPYRSSGVSLSNLLPAGLAAIDFNGDTLGITPSAGAFQYPWVQLTSVAIAGAPSDTIDVGTQISCSATLTPSNADIASYAWTVKVGGSTVATGSASTLNYTPSAAEIDTVKLVVTDRFGNQRTATSVIVRVAALPRIENRKPNGTLIADAGYVNTNVLTSIFNATDSTVTRNGSAYSWPSANTFTAEGTYVVRVVGVHAAERTFTIDKTLPSAGGLLNGHTYTGSSLTITFSDASPVTATLDGVPISSGTVITEEGAYLLQVTDAAGNVKTVGFCLRSCDET